MIGEVFKVRGISATFSASRRHSTHYPGPKISDLPHLASVQLRAGAGLPASTTVRSLWSEPLWRRLLIGYAAAGAA